MVTPGSSKLEAAVPRCRTRVVDARVGQYSCNSPQFLPCGFGQLGISADDVPDHLPRSHVESSLWSGPHGQRDGTLGTEADSTRRRFLPRPESHGLREHVYSDAFVSAIELPITAQTIQVLQ